MQQNDHTHLAVSDLVESITVQFLEIGPGTCGKLSLAGLRLATRTASDRDLDLFEFGGEADSELADYREAALSGIEAILNLKPESPPARSKFIQQ